MRTSRFGYPGIERYINDAFGVRCSVFGWADWVFGFLGYAREEWHQTLYIYSPMSDLGRYGIGIGSFCGLSCYARQFQLYTVLE